MVALNVVLLPTKLQLEGLSPGFQIIHFLPRGFGIHQLLKFVDPKPLGLYVGFYRSALVQHLKTPCQPVGVGSNDYE